jgi:hypothetical protein
MATTRTPDFDATFEALRQLLRAHAAGLTVAEDSPERFCLEATPGPAAHASWGEKARRPTLPVAWVERGRSYVGYHLMGLNGNTALTARLSTDLRARKQGKTCFNFRRPEEVPLAELSEVTAASIATLRRAGFVKE